jgi:hypothetical protein
MKLLSIMAYRRLTSTTASLMINPYISFPLVCDNQPEFFILILSTVLHPYYKLAYIKMAWGGPEDQAQNAWQAIQT